MLKEKTMSAKIPDTMLMSDLLKATGYDCPSTLAGKTFKQATATKLFAFGTAEKVVYTTAIPSEAGTVDVYVPAVTGLTKTTGAYAEATGVTVSDVAYARYDTGDIQF